MKTAPSFSIKGWDDAQKLAQILIDNGYQVLISTRYSLVDAGPKERYYIIEYADEGSGTQFEFLDYNID